MNIYFDVGNTRVKWCVERAVGEPVYGVFEHGGVSHHIENATASFAESLLSSDMCKPIKSIVMSCVASEECAKAVFHACEHVLGVEPKCVRVESPFLGVSAAYQELQDLGVDRWLALLAVHSEFDQKVIVIDAGSAITFDVIDDKGVHLGGYIAPGLSLLRRSLSSGTSQVAFHGSNVATSERRVLGRSTSACVQAGVQLMFDGFLSESLRQAALGDPIVVVAGGDSASVLELLKNSLMCTGLVKSERVVCRPNIVFDGLRQWEKYYSKIS